MMKTQKGIVNNIMGLYTHGRLGTQYCSFYSVFIPSPMTEESWYYFQQWNEISPFSKVYI